MGQLEGALLKRQAMPLRQGHDSLARAAWENCVGIRPRHDRALLGDDEACRGGALRRAGRWRVAWSRGDPLRNRTAARLRVVGEPWPIETAVRANSNTKLKSEGRVRVKFTRAGVGFSRAACPSTPEIERRPANYAERHKRKCATSRLQPQSGAMQSKLHGGAPRTSSPSKTSAGLLSNGSRRARVRSNGRA